MPGDAINGGNSVAPDVNAIPASMVERVEVLTGGASAVYGSDAVAGVVNFIMRKDFEGIEVDGQYSVFNADNDCGACHDRLEASGFKQAPTNAWDGDGIDTSVIFGANTGNSKGNVTAFMTFHHNEPVFESERDYSACSYNQKGNSNRDFSCGGSSNFDRFISVDTGEDFFLYDGGLLECFSLVRGDGVTPTRCAKNHPGLPRPVSGNARLFNYGPYNTFQRPDTRWTAGFFAHYEVEPWLEAYAEFLFLDDRSKGTIAPSALFLGSGPFDGNERVNCDNPLLTAQQHSFFCPNPGQEFATLEIGRRNVEGGGRQFDNEHEAWRSVVGIRGDLGDGWSYDVYAQYGRTNTTQIGSRDWSVKRVQNALLVDPATGDCFDDADKCVPLDIFHGFGAITPEMLAYVNVNQVIHAFLEEKVASGSLTGDLGSIGFQSPWAKHPVGIALGAEYRSEGIEIDPDDPARFADGFGSGGPVTPQPFVSFSVGEAFTEVQVPLVEEAPFAKLLQVHGAYRYSNYSAAGSTSTYSYGAEWQPIDDFRVRGSFQRAVRAPNVLELFGAAGVFLTSGTFNDPCFSNPAAFANCNAATGGASLHGTPAGDDLLSCPSSQCAQLLQGNRNLLPETSDTRSAGIVLTPTFIPGFSATVDYFNIKVSKAIGNVGADTVLNGCYVDNDPSFCALIHRNGTGQAFGSGFTENPLRNLSSFQVKGWDFEANYQTDLADWDLGNSGSVGVNFVGSFLDSYKLDGTECAGFYLCGIQEPQPEWRHKLRTTWSSPWDVDVSVQWRHFSGVKLLGAPELEPLEAVNYFDFSAVWHVLDEVELRAGVDNAFDVKPPLSAFVGTAPGNGNTFPGVYDALGRFVFIGGTVKM